MHSRKLFGNHQFHCRSAVLRFYKAASAQRPFNAQKCTIVLVVGLLCRGLGYLVSPSFTQRQEWQLLLEDATVWRELLIRPAPRPRRCTSLASRGTSRISGEAPPAFKSPQSPAEQPGVTAGGELRGMDRAACRVCRRKAKEGCTHCACKLCCEKLRAVATQLAADPQNSADGDIYVAGRGRLPLSAVGVAAHATCPVHRRRNLRYPEARAGKEHEENDCCRRRISRKDARPAPFESLSAPPCGVSLASSESGRPFMAMSPTELSKWCSEDQRRQACIDVQTGKFFPGAW